jgi:hypothetical protein
MSKNKQKQAVSPDPEVGLTLDELVKRGARQVIQPLSPLKKYAGNKK